MFLQISQNKRNGLLYEQQNWPISHTSLALNDCITCYEWLQWQKNDVGADTTVIKVQQRGAFSVNYYWKRNYLINWRVYEIEANWAFQEVGMDRGYLSAHFEEI